jgi:deoxyadenosine/deoxycytidine kinase
MESPSNKPLIGIVGPCGSGKSTLLDGLEKHGYTCRHIAQEHSFVQDMWQLITQPDLLVYLNASFPVSTARAKLDWQEKDYEEQLHRLEHARKHADLLIETDHLTPEEVLHNVLGFLTRNNL